MVRCNSKNSFKDIVKKLINELYKLKIEFINIFSYSNSSYHKSEKFNYDLYWDIRNNSKIKKPNIFHEDRATLLYEIMKEKNISFNSELLDIGSGDGRQLQAIQQKLRKLSITASDISEKSLSNLSENYRTITIDLNKDFITKKFDLITAFEVLEHIDKPEESLLYLLSKTELCFIFSVPNTGYIFHRLRLLFGSFPAQWKTFPGEHLRFWTYKDMKWWLTDYLGIDRNDYKIICYAYFLPFLVKLFPFLSTIFSKGLFVQINKKK